MHVLQLQLQSADITSKQCTWCMLLVNAYMHAVSDYNIILAVLRQLRQGFCTIVLHFLMVSLWMLPCPLPIVPSYETPNECRNRSPAVLDCLVHLKCTGFSIWYCTEFPYPMGLRWVYIISLCQSPGILSPITQIATTSSCLHFSRSPSQSWFSCWSSQFYHMLHIA